MTVNGIGGRIHAVEMAASLRHLAKELANDVLWYPVQAGKTEAQARIARLIKAAEEQEREIADYDRRMAPKLTHGEANLGIKGRLS